MSRQRNGRGPARHQRKALQLCRQVQRELTFVLGDSPDDVLRGLLVESVDPAPTASRLLVSVSSQEPTQVVLVALQRASGLLRSEIAGAIHRKRVPELLFRCVVSSLNRPVRESEAN